MAKDITTGIIRELRYILSKNTRVSIYPFLRNRGRHIGGTKQTATCYEVSHNSSPLIYFSFCLDVNAEYVSACGIIWQKQNSQVELTRRRAAIPRMTKTAVM